MVGKNNKRSEADHEETEMLYQPGVILVAI